MAVAAEEMGESKGEAFRGGSQRPKKAVVTIDPADVDEEGNISRAEVEFFYASEGEG